MQNAGWVMRSAVVTAGLFLVGTAWAASDDPKYTIKEVMEMAHSQNNNLVRKVAMNQATKEEKDQLLEYYTEMAKNKPPKGDAKQWKTRTDTLVRVAKSVVKGDKQAPQQLVNAANCMACHRLHKP